MSNSKPTWPRLIIHDGTLEALKWLALLLMTGDHIDKYLFNGTKALLFDAGRIAMPLFIFVLAYNLARPSALDRGAYSRTIKRLILFGVLATPIFIVLGGVKDGWWPLNIIFTLLSLTVVLFLVEQRSTGGYVTAAAMFLVSGSSVEFWWPALTLGVAIWWYCKRPGWIPLALALTALSSLWFINQNLWALAAVPIALTSVTVDLRVPRLKWVFYAYYPLHLAMLWLIRIPMGKVGCLFFY